MTNVNNKNTFVRNAKDIFCQTILANVTRKNFLLVKNCYETKCHIYVFSKISVRAQDKKCSKLTKRIRDFEYLLTKQYQVFRRKKYICRQKTFFSSLYHRKCQIFVMVLANFRKKGEKKEKPIDIYCKDIEIKFIKYVNVNKSFHKLINLQFDSN